MCIFGDPAHPLRLHLQAPFGNVAYNKSMSTIRVAVKWPFGDILNYFKFLGFKKNLKVGLSNVGKVYVVCALIRYALTCLY